jgi:hypothetical protein
MKYFVRALNVKALEELKAKIFPCFEWVEWFPLDPFPAVQVSVEEGLVGRLTVQGRSQGYRLRVQALDGGDAEGPPER